MTMREFCRFLLLVQTVEPFLYNQICTFSSGSCQWSIGRRWHVVQLNVDDQSKTSLDVLFLLFEFSSLVLVADGESEEDQRIGFTDAIVSPWLQLSAHCALTVRLTFQFSIENSDDLIEVYLVHENRTRLSSLGQWKGMNGSEEIEAPWQHANLTFTAAETFRLDIEVRHFASQRNRSVARFALDDLLVENCPIRFVAERSSTSTSISSTKTTTTTTSRENTTMLVEWNLTNPSVESETMPPPPRHTLLSLILYLLCALIALTLLIILLTILIYTYRKQCCPSALSAREMRRGRHQQQRIGIQIEKSDVRPCF